MTNLLKTLSAFVISSLLILLVSMPLNGIIEVENYTVNEGLSGKYASNFYDPKVSKRKLLEPVLKLIIAAEVPEVGELIVSSATGFSVAYDKKEDVSYIITNHHFCVNHKDSIMPSRIFFEDSKTAMSTDSTDKKENLHLVSTDPSLDLCLLKTNSKIRPVKLAEDTYQVRQLDKLITVGAPNGVFPIINETNVANLFSRDILPENMKDGDPLILVSDIIFGGQSGSPLYNNNGDVIGILFMGLTNDEGPIFGSLAIPIGDVHHFLKKNNL